MRLNKFYIDRYNLLKDVEIDFNRPISILIGINGSGKSSILEAIALIFSDAIGGQPSKFGFRLEYELRLDQILSQSSTSAKFRTDYIKVELSAPERDTALSCKVFVGKKVLSTRAAIEDYFKDINKIFPSNIIIYYSGLSEAMKHIVEPHDLEFSRHYREEDQIPAFHPFFYFDRPLFEIILLSLLSYEFGDIPEFLKKDAKIDHLYSAQIRLKRPPWAKGRKAKNWWDAGAKIKAFLEFLDGQGRSLIIDPSQEDGGRKGNVVIELINENNINITIIDQSELFKIREYLSEEKKLFEVLNLLYIDGFLDEIVLNFSNDQGNGFKVLSEGEKQTIIIKGLIELLPGQNTLFLFDEPDTYLHPSWQKLFIEGITPVVNRSESVAQFLITTHSPNLLSNANPDIAEVRILEEGEVVKLTPKYYGREIGTILYEMMGVERRTKQVARKISHLFNLIEEEKLSEATESYNALAALLGEDDPVVVRAKTQLNYLKEEKDEADH